MALLNPMDAFSIGTSLGHAKGVGPGIGATISGMLDQARKKGLIDAQVGGQADLALRNQTLGNVQKQQIAEQPVGVHSFNTDTNKLEEVGQMPGNDKLHKTDNMDMMMKMQMMQIFPDAFNPDGTPKTPTPQVTPPPQGNVIQQQSAAVTQPPPAVAQPTPQGASEYTPKEIRFMEMMNEMRTN